MCLVRDMKKKSYFIRVVNMDTRTVAFAQELYNEFKFNQARRYFYTFACKDRYMAGLNFSNDAGLFNEEEEEEEKKKKRRRRR